MLKKKGINLKRPNRAESGVHILKGHVLNIEGGYKHQENTAEQPHQAVGGTSGGLTVKKRQRCARDTLEPAKGFKSGAQSKVSRGGAPAWVPQHAELETRLECW